MKDKVNSYNSPTILGYLGPAMGIVIVMYKVDFERKRKGLKGVEERSLRSTFGLVLFTNFIDARSVTYT